MTLTSFVPTLRKRFARAPVMNAALAAATASCLVTAVLVSHPELSPQLTGPFAAVHGLLSNGAIAAFAYAALLVLLWPLTKIMAAMDGVAKIAGAAGLAVSFPFAQASDPGDGAGASARRGQKLHAAHEIQIGAYGGYNRTLPSTVRLMQPNGTDLTFRRVKWIGESFKTEPYWGVRTTYWSRKLHGVGFMFDYTHAKASALKSQTLKQSGTRDGQQVQASEPFAATFRKLEFTHGLNFFTLNALYRTRALHPRIAPYFGVGIGLSVPHVDTNRAGAPRDARTYKHQITGLAFQALGGIEWRLMASGRASAFTEYKLNYTSNRGKLNGGGHVETDLWTHQIPIGFSYHHWVGAR